tara:strand:- start:2870 stop:3124 length:255 start_codon:yes stop_codon:yes gene_type:complete
MHSNRIEGYWHMPDAVQVHHGWRQSIKDTVSVVPTNCGKSGMKILVNAFRIYYCDGIRPEVKIQRVLHSVSRVIPYKVDMDDLT